jgi:hypothetical protein
MQELLNIEQFCQRIVFKKSKLIRVSSWYCWKALDEWGFLAFSFSFPKFLNLRWGDIEF